MITICNVVERGELRSTGKRSEKFGRVMREYLFADGVRLRIWDMK